MYATDNVQVVNVRVTILDGEGQTLEQGEALPGTDGWWGYSMPADGRILVEAIDPAGKVTRYTEDL